MRISERLELHHKSSAGKNEECAPFLHLALEGIGRLSVLLGPEAIEALKAARDLLSHALPNASWAEVIAYLAKEFTRRKTAPAAGSVTKAKSCEYVDPKTGRRCESTYQLEVDHVIPRALGGTNHPSNLRSLCKQHNLLEAEKKLGRELMRKYRRSG